MDKYISIITNLQEEFTSRFQDFRENENLINLFAIPFSVSVKDVPGNLQIELINLQCNSELKEKYNLGLFNFYSKYIDKNKFPSIRLHAQKMMSLFGSTYVCEQLFSRIKHVKSKNRTRITDSHLENSLRIATSKIRPDIEKLVKNKQCQKSH